VDHQSLEDGTVTLRDRDSMNQKRVHRDELALIIKEIASMESLLKKV
jgi:glycyl-tRNA synthetase